MVPNRQAGGGLLQKPLSGAKFIEFRGKIMNLKDLEFTVQVDQCFHQSRLLASRDDTPKHSVIKSGYPGKEHYTLSTIERELDGLEQGKVEPVDVTHAYEAAD